MLQAIICGIFETIVDQSPFAIEDLMKELETGSDIDSSSENEKWSDREDTEMARGENLIFQTLALENSRKSVFFTELSFSTKTSVNPVHLEGN